MVDLRGHDETARKDEKVEPDGRIDLRKDLDYSMFGATDSRNLRICPYLDLFG